MKLAAAVVIAAALGTAGALSGAGRPGDAGAAEAPARTITVSGAGSVRAAPDQAELSLGVTTQADTATRALQANAALARRVIAAVKGEGVAAEDIQTASVYLSPRTGEDGSTILGYAATDTVSVTVRDLGKAGAVIDAGVEAGANEVSGPSLTRSDQDELYRRALRAAMADAKAKAQELARAGGIALGPVRSVVEGSSPTPPVPFTGVADAAVESTPVEPGTETIEAVVTVEFALL
jgi:uncharacterized protein YggE